MNLKRADGFGLNSIRNCVVERVEVLFELASGNSEHSFRVNDALFGLRNHSGETLKLRNFNTCSEERLAYLGDAESIIWVVVEDNQVDALLLTVLLELVEVTCSHSACGTEQEFLHALCLCGNAGTGDHATESVLNADKRFLTLGLDRAHASGVSFFIDLSANTLGIEFLLPED